MKVYLAAQFARQAEMRHCREDLLSIGWHVVSSWLDEEADDRVDPVVYGENDLWDLHNAEAIIFFTGPPYLGGIDEVARGGRHFELGWAYHAGKVIIIIGEPENIFHYFPDMQHFKTWEGFMRYVEV